MRHRLLIIILHLIPYSLFKLRHGLRAGQEEYYKEHLERLREVGTATRCKACGLSIRGLLGWTNRAIWGVAPNPKHPDLCNS